MILYIYKAITIKNHAIIANDYYSIWKKTYIVLKETFREGEPRRMGVQLPYQFLI